MAVPSSRRVLTLYWRWVLFCTFGELVGFGGVPVLGGAISVWATEGLEADLRAILLYLVAIAGGFGEGAVLAWFQLRVLKPSLPDLSRGGWITATGIAASIAWGLGFLAPTLNDLVGLSPRAQIVIWIPASVLILLSIGTAQAFMLQGIVARPRRWVLANAAGWLLGLPWTFVLPAMLPETAPIAVRVWTFVVAGVLMGLTVGLITGYAVVTFKREADAQVLGNQQGN